MCKITDVSSRQLLVPQHHINDGSKVSQVVLTTTLNRIRRFRRENWQLRGLKDSL